MAEKEAKDKAAKEEAEREAMLSVDWHEFVVVVRSSRVPSGAGGARAMEESLVALARRVVGRPGYGKPPAPGDPARPATGPQRRR